MNIVGVDIGATKLRVALAQRDGTILAYTSEPTVAARVVDQICARVRRFARFDGIGVASVGPLDPRAGVILNPPNIRIRNLEIVKALRAAFRTPCYLLNDAVASALGEQMFGAGRGAHQLVYVTLSTGIGCGAIVDGRILMGKDGNAHAAGHCTVDPVSPLRCGCGRYGHWEAYCGGKNIPAFARLLLRTEHRRRRTTLRGDPQPLTPERLFALAASDAVAAEIVDRIGMINGVQIANLINLYDPELITVGGAIALHNEARVLRPLRTFARRHTINRMPKIVLTPLGEMIGVYGAVASVLYYGAGGARRGPTAG